MATAAAEMPPLLKEEEPTGAEARQVRMNQLYDRCAQAPKGTIFFTRDLTNMAIAVDVKDLITLVQELVDRHFLKVMTFDNQTCWKLRSQEEAEKLRRLSVDERLLYQYIDQAQTEGIWSKALRARTNLTPQALNKCLKSLESKGLVQSVMSVKFPSRKMYLLAHLRPSEDMAGGPWQSEGEFDLALIGAISHWVEQTVRNETCISVAANYNDFPDRAQAVAQKKAQVQAVQDIEDAPAPAVKSYRPPTSRLTFVLRHDPKYPTAASLRNLLMSSGIIKDKVINEADMEQLLEMMVLEGRLEKISGTNYRLPMRALVQVSEDYNGFVDAPCGTCPVFDLCSDTGEISASTCVYFGEWLSTET